MTLSPILLLLCFATVNFSLVHSKIYCTHNDQPNFDDPLALDDFHSKCDDYIDLVDHPEFPPIEQHSFDSYQPTYVPDGLEPLFRQHRRDFINKKHKKHHKKHNKNNKHSKKHENGHNSNDQDTSKTQQDDKLPIDSMKANNLYDSDKQSDSGTHNTNRSDQNGTDDKSIDSDNDLAGENDSLLLDDTITGPTDIFDTYNDFPIEDYKLDQCRHTSDKQMDSFISVNAPSKLATDVNQFYVNISFLKDQLMNDPEYSKYNRFVVVAELYSVESCLILGNGVKQISLDQIQHESDPFKIRIYVDKKQLSPSKNYELNVYVLDGKSLNIFDKPLDDALQHHFTAIEFTDDLSFDDSQFTYSSQQPQSLWISFSSNDHINFGMNDAVEPISALTNEIDFPVVPMPPPSPIISAELIEPVPQPSVITPTVEQKTQQNVIASQPVSPPVIPIQPQPHHKSDSDIGNKYVNAIGEEIELIEKEFHTLRQTKISYVALICIASVILFVVGVLLSFYLKKRAESRLTDKNAENLFNQYLQTMDDADRLAHDSKSRKFSEAPTPQSSA